MDESKNNSERSILDLSVIIATFGRESRLKKCIESIAGSSANNNNPACEVIIVSNEISADLKRFFNGFSGLLEIKSFSVESNNKSVLRNFGIRKSSGRIIYFIDDDTRVKIDFIQKIMFKFDEYPEAAVIGGPNLNPDDCADLEKAQGYLLASLWGSLKMSRRYSELKNDYWADQSGFILCNLGFRRSILSGIDHFFDTRLDYNEENELLKRLQIMKHKMLFSPDIVVYHYRRSNIKDYFVQVFSSGVGRAKIIKINIKNLDPLYLLPLILILYLLILPAGIFYDKIMLLPLYIYMFISLCFSAAIYYKRDRRFFIMLAVFLLFFISHTGYGLGLIKGFLFPMKKNEDIL